MSVSPRTFDLFATIALALAAWMVWHASLAGGFLFDDLANLVNADGWKATSLAPAALVEAMSSGQTSDGGRPFAMLSFAINHALTRLDPWWLKATSLLLHLLNGLLAWKLVERLLVANATSTPSPRARTVLAWLVAAAWLVHPIQSSTVPYVVQRMEVGAAMGILVALHAYLKFRDRQLTGGLAWPWLAASAAGVLFGLGFKESAAIAPALALLVEWRCFGFRGRDGRLDQQPVSQPLRRSSSWCCP
jgi:protein O-mannosyl-transferase